MLHMRTMFYFYILRCVDNTLYCGQTNNLNRRMGEHMKNNKKSAKYLRGRKPFRLVYFEQLKTVSEALKREREVKGWKKQKKEELISTFTSPV